MNYRFYCFGSNYSPFSNPSLLDSLGRHGFQQGYWFNNNLIVCVNLKNAKLATLLFPWSKVIVWTHEPRYDSFAKKTAKGLNGKRIDVFNVFTGDVFWHNRHFLGTYHYDESIDLGIKKRNLSFIENTTDEEKFNNRRVCIAVYTKKDKVHCYYYVNSINVDANRIRQDIAIVGHEMGMCDIVGKGWEGLAIEESGYVGSDENPWWSRKIEIISNYRFNIAIENTIWPYYVTEKIWQSISTNTVPVYWGKSSSIYETFPPQSFVDASVFSSSRDLCIYLKNMPFSEWSERMYKCIETYNREISLHPNPDHSRLAEVIERIRSRISGRSA